MKLGHSKGKERRLRLFHILNSRSGTSCGDEDTQNGL